MKTNPSVSGEEKPPLPGTSLIVRTDTEGIVTFVNDAFVAASGFSREALIGRSYEITLHPDVPASVRKGMWRTLRRGLPWHGPIRSRRAGGDDYWVRADVVGIRKNGQTIGYMSVQTPADAAFVAEAEAAYRQAAGVEVHGEADRGFLRRVLSVRNGVVAGIAFVVLMMLIGGILGIGGLQLSNKTMQSLYYEQMTPVQIVSRIRFLMAENRTQVALALHHTPGLYTEGQLDHGVDEHLEKIVANRREIDGLWATYAAMPRDGEELELSEQYAQARYRYVSEGLIPARAALELGEYAQVDLLLRTAVIPLYQNADAKVDALIRFLSEKAESNFRETEQRNRNISTIAVVGLSASIVAVILSGFLFFRGTVSPLRGAVEAMERIAEGNLSGGGGTMGYGEPGRVMNAVLTMQLHLRAMMDEIRQSAGSIHEQCCHLNATMMNLAQYSEEQHDRIYQTLDAIDAASAGMSRLVADAERIADGVGIGDPAADAAPLPIVPMFEGCDDPELVALGLCPMAGATEAAVPEPVLPPVDVLLAAGAAAGPPAPGNAELAAMARELVSAARVELMTREENAAQIVQVASLIVNNRTEVQDAWAASQELERTARELDRMVKFFD